MGARGSTAGTPMMYQDRQPRSAGTTTDRAGQREDRASGRLMFNAKIVSEACDRWLEQRGLKSEMTSQDWLFGNSAKARRARLEQLEVDTEPGGTLGEASLPN